MAEWLKKEKELGIENPNHVVLSTVTATGVAHSRIVAIRVIENESLLFFTQKGTKKVSELLNNPAASMNYFFAMQQHQIILEGFAQPISDGGRPQGDAPTEICRY